MTTVVAAASAKDTKFHSALRHILARNFDAAFFFSKRFSAFCERAELAVLHGGCAQNLDVERLIMICKDARYLSCRLGEDTRAVAVVDSSDAELLRAVSATQLPAVTCEIGRAHV